MGDSTIVWLGYVCGFDDEDDATDVNKFGSGERLEFSLAVFTVKMTGARSMLGRDLGRCDDCC